MDEERLFIEWLRLPVLVSYLLQIVLLICFPVPSPVSLGRKLSESSALRSIGVHNSVRVLGAMARGSIALLAFFGAWVPLVVYLFPRFYPYLMPFHLPHGYRLGFLGAALLVSGNGLIIAAVLTLKKGTGFNTAGESERLLTHGVFGLLRHPVVAGMGLIYLGFLVAVPCVWTFAGIAAYGLHQGRLLKKEEELLEARFGSTYRDYKGSVGCFWPRFRSVGLKK